ncbi:hypothetical protein BWI15_28335 [Kribbella sp. ALI-6-A]|nr:hypothetical protein BWI15_28335 [Kribbella sp. ALI-6-A]
MASWTEPAEQARTASDADFAGFVAARHRSLIQMAYLLTQDRHHAEDLVQIALVKSWESWHRIHGDDPAPYVRRVLLNTYFAWWRRRRSRPEQVVDELFETAGTPYQQVTENTDLFAALRRLPKRMRAIVVLRYFEDLTEIETAAALGCSVGTVKSQSHRALAKLRVDPALVVTEEE